MRDLLGCAWPAVLDTARQPFKSTTWHAALTVALDRAAGGDLSRVTRLGRKRFDAAVRRQVARWDAVHPWQKIIDGVLAACASPAGVTAMRRGALERVALLLADWRDTRARLAYTEQRMIAVLGELGLTEPGHLDHRPVRGRRRRDPGRDRRPGAVHHRPGAGQALRPGAAAEKLRQLHRPHPHHRAGQARRCAWPPGAASGAR